MILRDHRDTAEIEDLHRVDITTSRSSALLVHPISFKSSTGPHATLPTTISHLEHARLSFLLHPGYGASIAISSEAAKRLKRRIPCLSKGRGITVLGRSKTVKGEHTLVSHILTTFVFPGRMLGAGKEPQRNGRETRVSKTEGSDLFYWIFKPPRIQGSMITSSQHHYFTI